MPKFARERVAPFARDYEEAKQYPSRLFEELASRGLMGMTAPEAVGGAGADYVSYALSLIEIAAADGALSTILSIQNSLIVSALLKDGTPAQQAGFLPSLISRRMIGAFAARLRPVTALGASSTKLLSTLVHALRVSGQAIWASDDVRRAAASRT